MDNKTIKNKKLKERILTISYKKGLSHIGSCITALPIIDEIFQIKKPDEKFVLSSGHAGLALYVILEKHKGLNAEKIFDHHGVHPDRCVDCGIDCSSGSLGHGLGVSVGMALADRSKNVYCLISDGECAEGSIWEALRIRRENNLDNIKIYLNFNRWGAYCSVPFPPTDIDPKNYGVIVKETNTNGWPSYLQGQMAHYKVLNEEEYKECLEAAK